MAQWDGRAWTGRRAVDPSIAAPEHRGHRLRRFFTQWWFWVLVAGFVVTGLGGAVGNNRGPGLWLVLVVIGLVLTLAGIVWLFWPLLRFGEIKELPLVVALGVASGAIAFVLGSLLEGTLEPHLRVPFAIDLWLSGPVEETLKLGIPLLLLVVARRRFGDPRTGVLMVLISAAVFGVGEGIQYIANGMA